VPHLILFYICHLFQGSHLVESQRHEVVLFFIVIWSMSVERRDLYFLFEPHDSCVILDSMAVLSFLVVGNLMPWTTRPSS